MFIKTIAQIIKFIANIVITTPNTSEFSLSEIVKIPKIIEITKKTLPKIIVVFITLNFDLFDIINIEDIKYNSKNINIFSKKMIFLNIRKYI